MHHLWYSFVSLLDIDLEIGFMCPKCERLLQVVIMDAISLEEIWIFDSKTTFNTRIKKNCKVINYICHLYFSDNIHL